MLLIFVISYVLNYLVRYLSSGNICSSGSILDIGIKPFNILFFFHYCYGLYMINGKATISRLSCYDML
jgi:hypothetical protein